MTTSCNPLIDILRKHLSEQGGRLSFAHFMELALYHPQFGYYNRSEMTLGKEGDFTTAAEISPLFAQCFAVQCQQIMQAEPMHCFLELGAGSGRFAGDLLQSLSDLGEAPREYFIYEISPTLQKKQQALLQTDYPTHYPRVRWLDKLPTEFEGIILANEVLDALPVNCFRIEKREIKERCVSWNNDQFQWTLHSPLSNELGEKALHLAQCYGLEDGYESEINLRLLPFIQTLTTRLQKGLILFSDYGYGQAEYYRPERKQGTLTCFYQHQKHDNPFLHIGQQDITAHVDFTAVIEEAALHDCTLAGYTTQSAFLLACGMLKLAAGQESQLSEIAQFRLHQAIKTLAMPSEMGERVKVMAIAKGIDLPLLGFSQQDRRRDL